jgi:uncharacterized membrane protein YccC
MGWHQQSPVLATETIKRGDDNDESSATLHQGRHHGVQYAVSIFIATAVLWFLVPELAETDPIWAISSMVATSDPSMKQAWLTRSRIINALVGCAVGLLFIALGGTRLIMLALAIALTVLLSSYVVRIQTMWRQAPISAAFVIAAGLEHHSRKRGQQQVWGAHERGAVRLCGRLVIAWLVSVVWPMRDPAPAEQPATR